MPQACALSRRVGCLATLLGLFCLLPTPARALELSAAERDWVQSHGRVRVVVGGTFEPFYRTSLTENRPRGYAIDIFELLAERAQLHYEYVRVQSAAEGLAKLRAGEADMTPFLRMSPGRQAMLLQSGVVLPVETVFVTRKEATDLPLAEGLAGKRIAVAADTVDDERATREFPRATILRFPTLRQGFEAVAAEQADAMLSELHSAIWLIEANLLANLQVRRLPGADRDGFGPGVRRDLPHLNSILAKALDTLTPAERAELARRWLPAGTTAQFASLAAVLSPAERDWVTRSGDVRAGFDASFFPFTHATAVGGFEGLGADVLRAALQKVGLRLVSQQGASFLEIYERASRGELNVVVGMARNSERAPLFHFIGPFVSSPTVIVTRQGSGAGLTDLADLGPARVGMLARHFLLPELRSRLPALRLVEFDAQEAVLDALAQGQLDAAIGNSHVVSRLVLERHVGQLRVAGVVRDGDSELYFGVPRSQPELARVLERGFAALTPNELAELRQRWLLVQLQPGLGWADVLRWTVPLGLALLTIVTVLWLANRRLRAAFAHVQAARAAAEQATLARGRFVAYLAHELRGGVGGVGAGLGLLADDATLPERQRPLVVAMRHSAVQVTELLERTLAGETALTQGVQLQACATQLGPWWREVMSALRLRAQAKGLQLIDCPPAVSAALLVDRTRLAQVLNNVIGNAIKFTAMGEVRVTGIWDAASSRLRIEVRDQGPGLSDEDRQRLFEPYAQGSAGKSAASGAGLGLTISREIVRAMGGVIESPPLLQPGLGSLFVIEVVLAPAPAPASTASQTSNPTSGANA